MTITYKHSSPTPLGSQEILNRLVQQRGIADVDTFFHPRHPKTIEFSSFFDKKTYDRQWTLVLELLQKIREEKGVIIVYCDYDADGITGGAILWQTLHSLGFSVFPYIPDRKMEGYGFSKKGIDSLIEKHSPRLIISVDHGIMGHDQIAYAKEKHIPVIITDHHTKSDTDPDAFAVFHTSELSGSGVAYFFAREIAIRLGASNEILTRFDHDYLALATIGTIADLVPLSGASRSIARYGLTAFQNISSIGFGHFVTSLGLDKSQLRAYDIGFLLAPRINAFGRLTTGMDALRLLCTKSLPRATELRLAAEKINTKRQHLVEMAMKQAEAQVDMDKKILVVKHDEWEEGIIGLIAGKLVQKYSRPALAFTRGDSGSYKASARSLASVHILEFLRSVDHPYTSIGGHAGAAGLSIPEDSLDDFTAEVERRAGEMFTQEMLAPMLDVDFLLPLPSYSLQLAEDLSQLEPFGMANPEPLFATRGILLDMKKMGKTGKHIKFLVGSEDGGALEMIQFNAGTETKKKDDEVTIIFRLGINEWNSRRKPQGIVEHIV